MRAHDQQRRNGAPATKRNAVAFPINFRFAKPKRAKLLAQIQSARLFTERRRRNRTDGYLLIRDFSRAFIKELKACAHLRRDEQLSEDLVGRKRSRRNHNE